MVVNQFGDPAEHRYITVDTESSTSTKRKLLCEARNIHGSASDSQTFNVISEFLHSICKENFYFV